MKRFGKSTVLLGSVAIVALLFAAPMAAGATPADSTSTPNPVDTQLIQACADGDESKITDFLTQGASITATDEDGFTPLMAATATSHPLVVKQLLGLKSPVDAVNRYGETALIIAGWKGDADSALQLCEAGAAVDPISSNGSTPLMGAVSRGDLDIMKVLLDHHADPNVRTVKGTALIMAAYDDKLDALKLLLDRGADPNVLALTRPGRDAALMPLTYAAQNGNVAMIDLLLQHGAKPDVQTGYTPFMAAAQAGLVSVMQTFKDRGAQIDAQDDDGETALMCAAGSGEMDAVKKLVEWKANLNLVDHEGSTALIHVLRRGWSEVALYLVSQGADIGIKDQNGETALSYAQSRAFLDVVAALKEHGAAPVDPHLMAFPTPRNPLTLPQAWGIAVGAIYLQINGSSPFELLHHGDDTSSSRQMLQDLWNVHNHDELVAQLNQLATKGHRDGFAKTGAQLAALDDAAFETEVAANPDKEAQARACRGSYQKWKDRTGLAFDFCRYVNLVNNGYAAGYLKQNEVWDLLLPIARKTQQSFSSWQEMADNFLDGREIWAGKRDPRYDAIVHLLVNPDDPHSPWQLPWNTDLGEAFNRPVAARSDLVATFLIRAGAFCARRAW